MATDQAIVADLSDSFRKLCNKRQLPESAQPRYNRTQCVPVTYRVVRRKAPRMNSQLAKKLRIQPGQRMLVLNAPVGYVESLGELPAGITVSTDVSTGNFDFVQVFAEDQAELNQFKATAVGAVTYDGLFWVCYPKKTSKIKSDLTRDNLWDQFEGLRPVSQIAIDETWSAMRFRPAALVNA